MSLLGINIGIPALGKSSASFFPSDLPNLRFWVKADAGTYIDVEKTILANTNNDPVRAWQDLSGNDLLCRQSINDDFRPTYKTDIQNGLPGLYFTGNDYLIAGNFAGPATDIDMTIYLVALSNVADTNQMFLRQRYSNTNIFFIGRSNLNAWCAHRSVQLFGYFSDVQTTNADSNAHILRAEVRGGDSEIDLYFDDVKGSGYPLIGTNSTAGATIGNDANRYYAEGYVFEIISYYRRLSVAEDDKVMAYLSSRWGISL